MKASKKSIVATLAIGLAFTPCLTHAQKSQGSQAEASKSDDTSSKHLSINGLMLDMTKASLLKGESANYWKCLVVPANEHWPEREQCSIEFSQKGECRQEMLGNDYVGYRPGGEVCKRVWLDESKMSSEMKTVSRALGAKYKSVSVVFFKDRAKEILYHLGTPLQEARTALTAKFGEPTTKYIGKENQWVNTNFNWVRNGESLKLAYTSHTQVSVIISDPDFLKSTYRP